MPDPASSPLIPRQGGFARRRSSDQATSSQATQPRYAHGRYNAPEGNAYAQRGYATPEQAFPQDSPLIYPTQSPGISHQQHQQQPQREAPLESFPRLHSFDPYAQAAWDWSQSLDFTQLPTPYEPQGELIQELQDRKLPADAFSSPLFINPLAPPPRPTVKSPKMKRKSDSELQTLLQQGPAEQSNPTKRRAVSRASSTASQSPAPTVLADAQQSPIVGAAQMAASSSVQGNGEAQRRRNVGKGTGPQGGEMDVKEQRRVVESSGSSDMLPAGRVFPIQIGSALFRLSGASLCSDAPSYFSHFFSDQLHNNGGRANDVRTLYIDRDPDTFRDIALHLQGYHIVPRDGEHFVKLFADAQFYSLPRLTKQLFKSDIFISIGGTPFRIPRDSFSAPGDSPNYFSLGFAQWFSTPSEVFPGLDRSALLRPPSISPPSVPNKSGEIFSELMRLLQGYDVEIRNETHRANLLRDARYFHLKGLEQRLVAHEKSYNLKRGQNEILMRLEDIRQSGVSFTPLANPSNNPSSPAAGGYVTYARPYTDDTATPHILILETSSSEIATLLPHRPSSSTAPTSSPTDNALPAHILFANDTLRRITSLLKIIAAKLNLPPSQSLAPTPLSLFQNNNSNSPSTAATPALALEARIHPDCALTLDGEPVDLALALALALAQPQGSNVLKDCTVRRAQWRVRIQTLQRRGDGRVEGEGEGEAAEETRAVLEAVRIDAFTTERGRNGARAFLG